MPGDPGATVVDLLVWFLFFPREAAVQRAPGIPHALRFSGADRSCMARVPFAPRECKVTSLHFLQRKLPSVATTIGPLEESHELAVRQAGTALSAHHWGERTLR